MNSPPSAWVVAASVWVFTASRGCSWRRVGFLPFSHGLPPLLLLPPSPSSSLSFFISLQICFC
uniref:Uncharacterized protein n=1 Tax=Fagus sylvatica TaxID=28930 RepID=A0A2N9HYP3_FAGSY